MKTAGKNSQEKRAIVDIQVTPKSSRSKIQVEEGGMVRVYLNAPPADGKANAECLALFSKTLGVPKSRIHIEKGEAGRRKRLLILGMTTEEVIKILKGEERG